MCNRMFDYKVIVIVIANSWFLANSLPVEYQEGNTKLIVDTVSENNVDPHNITINGQSYKEYITTATEHPPDQIPDTSAPHNITVGERVPGDRLFYTDNTVLENGGPSTLNGTISINIAAAMNITRVEAWDQVPDGWGAFPQLEDGGPGHNHVTIRMRTQYTRGFHFLVLVFGVYTDKMDADGVVEDAMRNALTS